jgi:hypothetical protein
MNEVTGTYFSEEPTVTGDAFLAMIEYVALRYASVGTVFQLDGAPPIFSRCVRAFLDREFHDRWTLTKRGTHS